MIPGKKYSPEDYLLMAWKRKWLIVIPAILITIGTAIYARTLPNIFRADTTIMIVPQQVPQDMVRATIQTRVDDRLNMISQQILSRPRLERIIEDFDLYRKERNEGVIMEDIIQRMRNQDIKIANFSQRARDDTDAFTVSYFSSDPRLAAKVAGKLADLFMDAHSSDRSNMAALTSSFLDKSTGEVHRQLLEKERELTEYKLQNQGQLPTETGTNLQMMTASQLELQNLIEGMNLDAQEIRRLELEISGMLALAQREAANSGPGVSPNKKALDQARIDLRSLEIRYTVEHPLLVAQKSLIADLEAKVQAEELQQPVSTPAGAVVGLSGQEQIRLAQLRLDHDNVKSRLQKRKDEEPRVVADINRFKANLAAAPRNEQQLVELTRDYTTLAQEYADLLRKSRDSQLATNMEVQQIGERFKPLDTARIPERPISPNRPQMIVKGLMFGLGVGLVLVAFLEYRDTTLKTDSDVVTSLTLPVLAVIPVILTERDERRKQRSRRVYAFAGVGLFLMAAGVFVVWKLDWIKDLVR
jgi:polysaccharide chain length determinant protein (PEP-CTERM system associated)